ncbi:histidine phosphatase family protein [Marinobacterium stanieri]|uniref:histidine phosphatase family protein n=1 Tax=Marinobacterium stanieri TaxID=49186 RepID=UPI003A8EEC69
MAELLLLRHGKAEVGADKDDSERTLKTRGKRDAQRIGHWLQQHDLQPDCIISSPAERALLTAEKCAKVMGIPAAHIETDDELYLGSPETLWEHLQPRLKHYQRIMLVAHNPGLEQLLQQLLDEPLAIPDDGKLMPTAALAHLSTDASIPTPGHWQLEKLIRPRTLPRLFAFEENGLTVWRDRPAYYYKQSGVLAYRIHEGELQLLMFKTLNNPLWKLAKGIIEPGLSAAESAAKEAWEELGIRGEVDPEPLGDTRHAKWGGECDLRLFAMRVTATPAEDQWWHDKRFCQWLSPEAAAPSCVINGMGHFIKQLRAWVGHD